MQLSVPNRTTPKSGSFDSNPGSVKRWVSALPMANIGETSRLLYAALIELNHQDIPTQQRFKALELLKKPVYYVTENMIKHFVGQPLPLSDKRLKIAHLCREITHALATGYKVLVLEQVAAVARQDRKLLITAIHRSIRLQGLVLLRAYQVYEPYPQSAWQELHSLYRYAESSRLNSSKVLDDSVLPRKSSTITDTYKQVLLLALACPYRLRQSETEEVYRVLEDWSHYSDLLAVDDSEDALFAVDLASDQPPSYRVLHKAAELAGIRRLLCTRRLAEQLRKTLTERGESLSETGVGQPRTDTLFRLMLAWGVMPKRRYSRINEHSQIIAAMGLSSIHYFVSGEVAFNDATVAPACYSDLGIDASAPEFQDDALFQRGTPPRTDVDKLSELWNMDFRIEGQAAPSATERAVARAAAGSLGIDSTHCVQSWKMVNVSAGGYCLLWDNPDTTRAQVGELLGIREASDPDTFHWRLGVIRWLKSNAERGLELGVQMLSPGAVGVAARVDGKTPARNPGQIRGLLLPEIASIQQRSTLLLPSPPFRVGELAIVNCHGRDVRVRLTKLVENTGSFAQFQFASLGEIEPHRGTEPRKATTPREFDDIWGLL